MSCSPYDLHDYLFEELTPAQTGEVRAHLKTCALCTAEFDRLRSTQTILLALRDEDMPQRLGFVSDKVFQPSPVRRWFSGFWTSAARLGFVSSALLSAAILVHAFLAPAGLVPAGLVPGWSRTNLHNSAPSALTQAEIDRRIDQAVAARIDSQFKAINSSFQAKIDEAVTQAVAETEQRAQKRTNALLDAADKRLWQLTIQTENSRYTGLLKNAEIVKANFGSAAQ